MGNAHAINDFLRRLSEDRRTGVHRELADYQAEFPGCEEEIAAEWAAVTGAESVDQAPFSLDGEGESLLGRTLGPYRLDRVLGQGGQGVVFLAEDERLHRRVALKALTRFGRLSRESLSRFQREAEVGARIDHPGICPVFDAGEAHGIPFIVMRFVEGPSLLALLDRARAAVGGASPSKPRVSPLEDALCHARVNPILEFVAEVATALDAAHQGGVLHRDIKPGNVLVGTDDRPVLVDFGVAREETVGPTLTHPDALIGTPAYMAPELLARVGAPGDARSDVYSLGVVLYEVLTLRLPFEAAEREALYRVILQDDPPDPRRFHPRLHPDVVAVIGKALEKEPHRRYGSAREFAEDLRRLRAGIPSLARPLSKVRRTLRWVHRHPAPVLAMAGMAALVLLCGFLWARWPEYQRARRLAQSHAVASRVDEAWVLLAEGEAHGAADTFERIATESPDEVMAWVGWILAESEVRGPEGALSIWDRRTPPDGFALRVLKNDLEARLGRDPAPWDLKPTSGVDLFVVGWTRLGESRSGRLRWEQAADDFTRALLHPDPAPLTYYLSLAEALEHVHRERESRELVTTLRRVWPHTTSARFAEARALRRVDRTASLSAYEEVRRLDSAHQRAFLGAFSACLDEPTDLPGARRWLDLALGVDPNHRSARLAQVRLLEHEGRLRESLDLALSSIELAPRMLSLTCGHLHLRLGENEEAVVMLRRAVAENPRYWESRDLLGRALMAVGDVAVGLDAFRQAVALEPRAYAARANLGLALLAIRQDQAALQNLEVAAQLAGAEASVWLPLARAQAFCGQLDPARVSAERVSGPEGESMLRRLERWKSVDDHVVQGTIPQSLSASDRRLLAACWEARGAFGAAAEQWAQSIGAKFANPMEDPRVRASLCVLRQHPTPSAENRRSHLRAQGWLRAVADERVSDQDSTDGKVRLRVLSLGLETDPALDAVRRALASEAHDVSAGWDPEVLAGWRDLLALFTGR